MNLNGIMLIEKSKRQTLYDITYMWSQKSETSEYNKKRNNTHRHKENKLIVTSQEKEKWEGQDRGKELGGKDYYV